MLRDPKPFRGGWRDPGGGHWIIPKAGEDEPEMEWVGNPRHAVPPAAFHVVRLYYRHKGGMAPGPLPDAGGTNDQAAWLLSAFGILAAAEQAWENAAHAHHGADGRPEGDPA